MVVDVLVVVGASKSQTIMRNEIHPNISIDHGRIEMISLLVVVEVVVVEVVGANIAMRRSGNTVSHMTCNSMNHFIS